jgi:hypothetical protein
MNAKIICAWQIAAENLGISVTAPYEKTASSGEVIVCEAYLPDFGSASGAVVLSHDVTGKFHSILEGCWCSVLHESYESYDQALFVDTLNDWGWFGAPETEPHWYSGAKSS